MISFLLRRIVLLVLTLFVVSVAIFAISELAPGNIAVNVLGNTITPAQQASFNAQQGLDQPAITRYVRWMFGSDWQASRLIGAPVQRITEDARTGRYGWYAITPEGIAYRNYTPDGETMYRVERLADGTSRETALPADVWKTNQEGIPIFWGVDREGRAAMWVRGDSQQEWTLTKAGWTNQAGAPRSYIPLQKGLLRGDPGTSIITRRPVIETLAPRLVNTLFLAGTAFIFIMPIALALGILAGLNQGRTTDRVLSIAGLIATATPEFASGVVLIIIFAVWLRWFPGAVVLPSGTSLFDRPQMLVLPVLTLTLVELGYVLRITRASIVEVMRSNYIRTAILKGLPFRRVVLKHALRNALLAPITVIMLHVNWLVGGVVVVEALFGFPGLGRYILDAALTKDVFAIEAAAMILVVVAVSTQLVADLIYVALNPRIRYS